LKSTIVVVDRLSLLLVDVFVDEFGEQVDRSIRSPHTTTCFPYFTDRADGGARKPRAGYAAPLGMGERSRPIFFG